MTSHDDMDADVAKNTDPAAASPSAAQSFDLLEITRQFPETSATMLLDRYLVDSAERSVRVFRVYRPTPAHFHRNCDETLVVLSGRGRFWSGDPSREETFQPGMLLCFGRGTVHAMPAIEAGGPVVFLAVDTPRRDPADVVFAEGSPETFIAEIGGEPNVRASA